MGKKVFFTDLDGTLLTDEKKISPVTRKAVTDFIERGHYFAICTGRPIKSAVVYYDALGISDQNSFIISYNGAQIYDCEHKKTVFSAPLSYELTQKLFEISESLGVYIQTFSDDNVICKKVDENSNFYHIHNKIPFLEADDIISVLPSPPSKAMCIELHDLSKLEKVREAVNASLGDKLQMVYSAENYLEFFSLDAGKGNAVRGLCDYLNIPIEDSVAAGDQQNDISMLSAAGLSIAMCNGTDEVKKIAGVVTSKDNNHDGLAEFFDRYK